ncbi:hypothetical protein WJ95_20695 [Burkholderia ubonensis]|nr:hypothetical protein WJ95_20695 [Burkholderia ubonensis]
MKVERPLTQAQTYRVGTDVPGEIAQFAPPSIKTELMLIDVFIGQFGQIGKPRMLLREIKSRCLGMKQLQRIEDLGIGRSRRRPGFVAKLIPGPKGSDRRQ